MAMRSEMLPHRVLAQTTITEMHMAYVDGFVIPIPRKKLALYRRQARKAGKIWRELGAVEFRECAGDDLIKKASAYPFRSWRGSSLAKR
jgi:hypothetical protein